MIENNSTFMVGNIEVSSQHNVLSLDENSSRIQPKVMAVLQYLAQHADRVISNDELLEHVWQGRVVTHSSIQKSVNALRTAFAELDSGQEYVTHFSKRGYQLAIPVSIKAESQEPEAEEAVKSSDHKPLMGLIIVLLALVGSYGGYLLIPHLVSEPSIQKPYVTHFTQVQPYGSKAGGERVLEPYAVSNRAAFVRNVDEESRLFILGAGGREWQVSVARGQFVDLAWSPSGRNLVAVDVHSKEDAGFYTFHIFTLDFKGEKVIEKNLLSHWLGQVNSVSWLDENVFEFVASQGEVLQTQGLDRSRYRYGVADQNLTKVPGAQGAGELLESQLLNQRSAVLSVRSDEFQLQFFGGAQELIGEYPLDFDVVSMSWVLDGSGVLLLADDNRLFNLYMDGTLIRVDYSPQVKGVISRARSSNDGRSIVLTVDADASSEEFMTKGGGFIYSAAHKGAYVAE